MAFQRVASAIYPQVYKTFESKGEEFCIVDLVEEQESEALDLLVKYVLPEENFCKAIQIQTKENAMRIISENYKKLFKKQMSLACVKKSSGELVGLNVLGVVSKSDPKPEPVDDPDITRKRTSSQFTDKLEDTFEAFQVAHILSAFGLGVKPEYRGRGIAVKLLLSRIPLMKLHGLNITLTSFSTLSSQKAAAKAGYTEISSISYEELQSKLPDFDFSKATGTHCKNFVLQVEQK